MKKAITKLRNGTMILILFCIISSTFNAQAKPSMGILPVGARSFGSSLPDEQQQQSLTQQMQEYLSVRLTDFVNTSPLSREHILLLMKEVPAPDPENLTADAIKIISRKENLMYLLKCSIESIQVQNENVRTVIHLYIAEGNSGKKIWVKKLPGTKIINNPLFSEHLLLNELFKPMLDEIVKEVKTLSL